MTEPKLIVIDVVGLTPDLLTHAPRISALAAEGFMAPMDGVLPGLTCSAQATMLTGVLPREHGIVGNGWYFRDLSEVWLWRQSNHLVQGPKLPDELAARTPPVTVAKMFWWYNMYSAATWSLTPRPEYPADGRKIPGVYSHPAELATRLQERLGRFPLFEFWGPTASINSTRWIVDATLAVLEESDPGLCLAYLPHLDYDLQRLGPQHAGIAAQVRAVDAEVGRLIDRARETGRSVIVVSEYGITAVDGAIEVNRALRQAGLLQVQQTSHGELLDAGASRAFAVADHQIAHVYVQDPRDLSETRRVVQGLDGVEAVWDREQQAEVGLDHPRSGELVALSARDRFFAYHYWQDEAQAPDFAPTVDIHRKPGYDPSELFFDPDQSLIKLKLGWKLLRKKLGFRVMMNAISLRPDLARGSHGRLPDRPEEAPVFIASDDRDATDQVAMTSVKERILRRLRSG